MENSFLNDQICIGKSYKNSKSAFFKKNQHSNYFSWGSFFFLILLWTFFSVYIAHLSLKYKEFMRVSIFLDTLYICIFFSSSPLADFKGNAIMNLSTMNNPRIMTISINYFMNNIASKIHENSLVAWIFLYASHERERRKE